MKFIFAITLSAIFGQSLCFRIIGQDDFQICQNAKPVKDVEIENVLQNVYVKYETTNYVSFNKIFANMDSMKLEYLGGYNNIFKEIDKQKNIFEGQINFKDKPEHGISYKIVAYEPNQYFLVYGCAEFGAVRLVERYLMTTNLYNNLDAPLAVDRGMGFSTDLIELPFDYVNLIGG
uniref:NtA domain-containing protein n=1 Tax=Clastoptera arizonana TaxID=38151 RepID=A0A1B6DIY1_9HEMI